MSSGVSLLLSLIICGLWLSSAQDIDFPVGSTRVRFLGKSPNFQIYPNTSLESYLQLRFSKFEERDSSNKKVQGHSVESLASAGLTWYAAAVTLDDTNLTIVRMTLDPTTRNGFSLSCPSSSSRRVLLEASPLVQVTVGFGFDKDTSVRYGSNENVSVSKGGIKFNVEYSNWPFCNENNTLSMEINLLLKGNTTAQPSVSTASDGTQVLSVPLGEGTTSKIYFSDHAYDEQNGTRKMSVGVTLAASGSTSTVTLRLPNPNPNTTLYYDPTVLISYDGAAGAIRTAWWSALLAVLMLSTLPFA